MQKRESSNTCGKGSFNKFLKITNAVWLECIVSVVYLEEGSQAETRF